MNITVLIANFNYGRFLEKAIKSCLNQTLSPKTVVIVDDSSTDSSWDIISSFTEQNQQEEDLQSSPHGNIHIKVGNINGTDIVGIRLPVSVGPSEARNVGIQFTLPRTDIYAILDSDDEMLPNKLEECVKPFVNPYVGVTYANYFHCYENSDYKIIEVKEPYSLERLNQECIVHSGSLIRSSVLEKVKDVFGFYDRMMRACEDWELWIRASKICLFHHVPLALTNVLIHNNNSTNSVRKEIWEQNWSRIRQKHFSRS